MLRVASLLILLPVAGVLAQRPIHIAIDDSAGTARYAIVRGSDTSSRTSSRPVYGLGRVSFDVPARDSATVTASSEGGAPVRVQVSGPAGSLSAVGAFVTVRVIRNSVSIEARDRSGLVPAALRRPQHE